LKKTKGFGMPICFEN